MNEDAKDVSRIPRISNRKRVIIVGAGFGGLQAARILSKSKYFQVVLLDINNFHQFQPLFYQVATSGLEPSSISFPLRKIFQRKNNVHFRVARVTSISASEKVIETSIGQLVFDYLILSYGATTNFFGNDNIEKFSLPMKSTTDSIAIRNAILNNYEKALSASVDEEEALMNIVIVGGGPTGVELAGALAEMRQNVLPKDYPELDFQNMKVYLLEGGEKLLPSMSVKAGSNSLEYLKRLGVLVKLESFVSDYDGNTVRTSDETKIKTKTLLWAAGIKPNYIKGLHDSVYGIGNRIQVDPYNEVINYEGIYAIGDLASMKTGDYPKGHPQVAQPAIQQGKNLAKNLIRKENGKKLHKFKYKDPGSLATVGRRLAVADLPYGKAKGSIAWLIWLFVHIMYLVGVKNRLFVFINWMWSYFTYDQSLRLVIKPEDRENDNRS
jgi:NADH dehydrogenase